MLRRAYCVIYRLYVKRIRVLRTESVFGAGGLVVGLRLISGFRVTEDDTGREAAEVGPLFLAKKAALGDLRYASRSGYFGYITIDTLATIYPK